jgi:PEP-CTERM motif-containing protein
LELSNGPAFSVSQIYQNVVTKVGDELNGYGKVDSINSIPIASLCSDCELTYVFDGYRVVAVSPSEIRFSGGSTRYYLGFGADKDFTTQNGGGSAGDLAEATNGTLFLSLKGHALDAAGNTLIGTGVGIGTLAPTGFETGLSDVDTAAGGIANAFFDADGIAALFGGPADFQSGASFAALQPVYPAECPGGPACLRGSTDFNTLSTAAVPEPASLALFGSALGAFAFLRRRRQARRRSKNAAGGRMQVDR